ncbi:carcinoembryonic antigen-related cell adhesion molecule 18 [Sorex fumeus]|uniref:carcinoembryonic antigen-related cell adhesion molecule 18 n=1 Tax=Sorex fumeus TaxID=62283 RepID=UPI0024AE41DD|nr:carcinoembryonic antigen-related cell adhesion molecule 18 [Sorex fumeus]
MVCGIHLTASQMFIDPGHLQYLEGEAILFLMKVPDNATEVSWHRGSEPTAETLILSYFPLKQTWHQGPMFSHRENMTEEFLFISRAELKDTGNYTAKAVSKNGVQTATALLRIGEIYLKPVLTLNTSSAVEYLDAVTASCSTNTTQIKWYLSDTQVASNDQMTLSSDNKTLTIHWVSRSDSVIECMTVNSADMIQKTFAVLSVSYGPDSITLMSSPFHLDGVLRADLGSRVEMNCSAYLPQTPNKYKYHWTHFNTLQNFSGTSITLKSLTEAQLGRYRCTVENPATQIIMYQDVWVQKSMYIPDPSDGFLLAKPLVVLLIVLAVLGGISLCGMLLYTLIGPCSKSVDSEKVQSQLHF